MNIYVVIETFYNDDDSWSKVLMCFKELENAEEYIESINPNGIITRLLHIEQSTLYEES